jgi:hypothetical protein
MSAAGRGPAPRAAGADRTRDTRRVPGGGGSDGEYQVLLVDGTKLGLSRTDRVDLPSF